MIQHKGKDVAVGSADPCERSFKRCIKHVFFSEKLCPFGRGVARQGAQSQPDATIIAPVTRIASVNGLNLP